MVGVWIEVHDTTAIISMMVVVEKEKEMEEVVAWRLEMLKQVIGIVGFFYWNENLNVSL